VTRSDVLLVGFLGGGVLGLIELVGEGVAGRLSAGSERGVAILGDVLVGLLGGAA
jgi:hypothetical protein